MAVRNNPKSLTILVSSSLYDLPEIKSLVAKGHSITVMKPEEESFDIIFSERAWRMTEELASLVDVSVKARRAIKYKRKTKENDDDE